MIKIGVDDVLSREERVLLELLKMQMPGITSTFSLVDGAECDWDLVAREASHQAVSLLAFDAASKANLLTPELADKWFRLAGTVMASNLRVSTAQNDLVTLLASKGYETVILKGASAAEYYLASDLRTLGDIDFFIDVNHQHEYEEILESAAFIREKGEHFCHINYHKDGVSFEMHLDFPGVPAGEKGTLVRSFLSDIFEKAHRASLDGCTYFAPSKTHHGLILLLHMQGHMLGEGLGLRHLCDWACFLNATHKEAFWEEELLPFLKDIGLLAYAAVMTKTAHIYLGTICPPWATNVEDSLCEQVILDIFEGGNFGHKDKRRIGEAMMISQHEDSEGVKHGVVTNLYRTLHSTTALIYPIVKKYRLLYPLYDIWRVFRYLFYVLIGKRSSLTKLTPSALKRRALYEQLHVFETED